MQGQQRCAPIFGEDDPFRIPGRYVIYLQPGYTFEKHNAAVHTDMKEFTKIEFTSLYPDRIVYVAGDVDDVLLERVRGDEGVEKVLCDRTGVEPEGGITGDR
jgi:hypothetical protein